MGNAALIITSVRSHCGSNYMLVNEGQRGKRSRIDMTALI